MIASGVTLFLTPSKDTIANARYFSSISICFEICSERDTSVIDFPSIRRRVELPSNTKKLGLHSRF